MREYSVLRPGPGCRHDMDDLLRCLEFNWPTGGISQQGANQHAFNTRLAMVGLRDRSRLTIRC